MALATLAETKTYLGIAASDTTHDAFLQMQLDLVSDTIEAFCRRSFSVKTYSQVFYAEDICSDYLDTYMYPLVSVQSIVSSAVPAPVIDITRLRIHKPTGRIEGMFEDWGWCGYSGWGFGQQETSMTVVYQAGFVTVPSPVKAALMQIVKERYSKQTSGVGLDFGSDVQTVTIPGTISIAYDYSLNDNDASNTFGLLLGSQQNMLTQYRSDRATLGPVSRTYVEEIP